MKNILLITAIFIGLTVTYGQKQGNIWYFGSNCGLDFSTNVPVVLSNGQTGSDVPSWLVQEGTSCISDSSGSVLFYTSGKTIWNKNHVPMSNGSDIMGGISSTQSSLIVPLPGSDSVFYVFTSDDFQNLGANGYRYSIVDMCLNNGKGDVVSGQKNIFLGGPSTEKLAACEDSNGTGYWITGHKMYSDEFYSWHLTSLGIVDTVISPIGTVHGWHNPTSTWYNGAGQGEMKFNPTGTKLALAIGNFDPAYLDLFDFDNSTGMISNFCHFVIDSIMDKRIWGVEFSPDGSKLYATLFGGSGGKMVSQYDLTAGGGNCNAIIASRFQLFQSTAGTSIMFGIKLAPNGKIYLVGNTHYDISSIDFPNLSGLSAGFNLSAITLPGTNSYELPCLIAGYKYYNNLVKCDINTGLDNFQMKKTYFSPNPFSIQATLQTDNLLTNAILTVYNYLGQPVKEIKNISGQTVVLDRGNLSSGLYFIKLTQDNETLSKDKLLIVDN